MVTKQMAELLRKIKACRDILADGKADAAALAATADELTGLLAELKSAQIKSKSQSVQNGGSNDMNEKLAIVAINKALRRIPLTDEERQALRNEAGSPGQQGETPAKGGYLVPKQFVAAVERLADEDARLKNYVHVFPTTFRKGQYPIRDEAATGLTKRSELNALTGKDIKFGAVEYDIENWYDFIPVAEELVDDANVDILEQVREAFAEDLVKTENSEILTVMNTAAGTAVPGTSYTDIVTALDTGIKVAARKNAVIVTNQNGWAYLDGLTDTTGRPLLVEDIKQDGVKRFKGAEVVVLDNTTLPNESGAIPVFVGDLRRAVLFADRKGYEVVMSREAGFLQGAIYLKISPRFDVVKKFNNVLKKLLLTITEETEEP